MINAIKEKDCKENLVRLQCPTGDVQLIISPEEIIFLKKGNKILINKYNMHPQKVKFTQSDSVSYIPSAKVGSQHLFEYNKVYLNYTKFTDSNQFGFEQKYFLKGTKRALYFSDELDAAERFIPSDTRQEAILSRREVERIFNPVHYDSMYIMDRDGNILYASNVKDGFVMGKNIIPSDEEIVQLELEHLKKARAFAYHFNLAFLGEKYVPPKLKAKSIQEIKNFNIYAPDSPYKFFDHFLVTSKNGKFQVQCFNLKFLSTNKFQLMVDDVSVLEPNVDDAIQYAKKNKIRYLDEFYMPYDMSEEVEYIDINLIDHQQTLLDSDFLVKVDQTKGMRKVRSNRNGCRWF